ncbi:SDR family NAD(P)-dependent oxidoreductase [Dactylosporangium sp. CA-233914]|uniref:SDR family NAD(P)-dependent oxidoreductase n=1 Tax=Dactylosporangium sp. CA-233914 TaxID=3239934 RepID=UPI003D92009A
MPEGYVVVTGAAGGIGASIAAELRILGRPVVATDIRETSDTIALDVTSDHSVLALAERLGGEPVAGLVNAAGVLQDVTSLLDPDPDQAELVWKVNYHGAMRCIRHLTPLMRPGAAVVNITSVNAHRPLPLHAYAPAKVALEASTRLAAGELGSRGIRVNAVAPGFTRTPELVRRIEAGERDVASIERATALGRLVDPHEVAAVTAFLLGDSSTAVTGVSIPVDCGWLATAHWMDYGERLRAGHRN